jgi:hypothetical protein
MNGRDRRITWVVVAIVLVLVLIIGAMAALRVLLFAPGPYG